MSKTDYERLLPLLAGLPEFETHQGKESSREFITICEGRIKFSFIGGNLGTVQVCECARVVCAADIYYVAKLERKDDGNLIFRVPALEAA